MLSQTERFDLMIGGGGGGVGYGQLLSQTETERDLIW